MFDEQDEVAHLAVLAPRLSQVYLFRLLFDGGKLSEVHELRTELAADIHLCICTRPQLNDLLLIGLDGHCHVLSASAAKFDLSLKVSDPQSTRVTNYVLQPSPRTPQTHDLRKWGHRDPLVEQSWRALSRVLSAEEFQQLFQAFLLSKTNHSTGDWTALEELLLEPPDVQELDLWQEFVLTQTQQRVQDRKKTSFHPRMKAAAPRVLQALHLLFQDCLCFHSRWQDAHRLGRLLVELSADLDWSTWQEYYRRSGYNCGRVVSSKGPSHFPQGFGLSYSYSEQTNNLRCPTSLLLWHIHFRAIPRHGQCLPTLLNQKALLPQQCSESAIRLHQFLKYWTFTLCSAPTWFQALSLSERQP